MKPSLYLAYLACGFIVAALSIGYAAWLLFTSTDLIAIGKPLVIGAIVLALIKPIL